MSYEIHPETPPEGVPLERLLGPGVARYLEPLRQRALELGLPFEPPSLLSNTRLACEAAEFAREKGKHAEFHREVLAAYFARSEDIGEVEVLARAAGAVGLDPVKLREALAGGAYRDRREAAEMEAREFGVSGVPTFFFADGTEVVGAQPLESFRRLLAGMGAHGA